LSNTTPHRVPSDLKGKSDTEQATLSPCGSLSDCGNADVATKPCEKPCEKPSKVLSPSPRSTIGIGHETVLRRAHVMLAMWEASLWPVSFAFKLSASNDEPNDIPNEQCAISTDSNSSLNYLQPRYIKRSTK
jgi:hypothetical protein